MQWLKEKFLKTWNTLPVEKKKKFVLLSVGLLTVVVAMFGYMASRPDKQPPKQPTTAKTEEIRMDAKLLEKTQLAETQKQLEEMRKKIEELEKERAEQQKALEEAKKKEAEAAKTPPPSPPPPLPTTVPPAVPPPTREIKSPEPPKPELVGSIGIVSGTVEKKEDKRDQQQKDTKKKYYLPPSFMEATLLSGLDAPAVTKGEGHPVPALFRIKAPAVLPNQVKANLKGCFVIAEGLGSLSDERVHLRLVTLSCIDKKGNAVIDQKVKGFVVDGDGKIGLRGRVVSKVGSVLARSLIAGLFSGLGQVYGTQAYSFTVTGAGTVSTLDPGKAAQAAIGSGISQAANELQKFYLELARQTIPVIEVQATRTVTLIVSEGVELEVKEYNLKDQG